MDFVQTFLGEMVGACFTLSWTCALFIAVETVFAREGARVSALSRLKAIAFWLVYLPIIMLMAQGIVLLWQPLGVKPLLPDLAPPGLPRPLAAMIAAVAAAFIGDFIYYWVHRAQHRFFWRFHAVHHSVREMHGLSAYHHVSEELFQFALYTVPLSFFTADPQAVPILGTLLALQGNYLHSPIRLNFGPLGRYFADNRFHRIHHSMDEAHFDKNFGIFTTLWDSVFGTAYFPAPGEWPQTGVADVPEPATIGAFLTAPFVYRRRAKASVVAKAARAMIPDAG